ncbi:MAG TPA: MOSC N-terminal beta barrel domain-containing protein [Allosphingosinicella sp.]|nr:MOSC N-terminal beta barrel domain-containing protein [Allosphingosinicella sp.]
MSVAVGTVIEITRYPVKSMAGEPLSSAELDWQGIEGDRQYCFYRMADKGRFPWLSGRDFSALVTYRARFRDPADPRSSQVDVITPGGSALSLGDPSLLAEIADGAGCALGLLQSGRGLPDAMPVSIVSTATHGALGEAHGAPLDRRRFRGNILIDSDVRESEWRGARLRFGSGRDGAELLVADPIPRCALITIDPDTGVRDAAVIRTVARQFANLIGIYALPARPGIIRLGDAVYLGD